MPDGDVTLYEVFSDPIIVTITFSVYARDGSHAGCWTRDCSDCDESDKTLTGFYGDPIEMPEEWGRPRLVLPELSHESIGWYLEAGGYDHPLPSTFPEESGVYVPRWGGKFIC